VNLVNQVGAVSAVGETPRPNAGSLSSGVGST
jgi:hypothetical protein